MFQKKKVEEIELAPLTEKEIKTLKDKLTDKEEFDNLNIKDLDIKDLIPQSINAVIVNKLNDKHCLILPDNMDGGKFKTWRKSRGGMFNKDVLNYLRRNEHGKYILIEGNGERKIVRLIEDDELLLFQTLRLIKGIVKDKPYMLLRNLNPGEKLTCDGRYIEKDSEHKEEIGSMNIVPQVKVEDDDDHDPITSSVSLFDE